MPQRGSFKHGPDSFDTSSTGEVGVGSLLEPGGLVITSTKSTVEVTLNIIPGLSTKWPCSFLLFLPGHPLFVCTLWDTLSRSSERPKPHAEVTCWCDHLHPQPSPAQAPDV